jgi:hypothetical protein
MTADYALWWIDGTPYAPMPRKLKAVLNSGLTFINMFNSLDGVADAWDDGAFYRKRRAHPAIQSNLGLFLALISELLFA